MRHPAQLCFGAAFRSPEAGDLAGRGDRAPSTEGVDGVDRGDCFGIDCGFRGMDGRGEGHDGECECSESFHFLFLSGLGCLMRNTYQHFKYHVNYYFK